MRHRRTKDLSLLVISTALLASSTAAAETPVFQMANAARHSTLKIWSSPLATTDRASYAAVNPACAFDALGPIRARVPFGVGERATYELNLYGLPVGKLETKVGTPRWVNGRRVVPLMAQVKTSTFLSAFQSVSGRYMTTVDAGSFAPMSVKMNGSYGDDDRWERASFGADAKDLTAAFRIKGWEGSRTYSSAAPMHDVLSMIYAARARALGAGATACGEVYAGRRLWRMDLAVRGPQMHREYDRRLPVIVVEARFERMAHPHFDPKRQAPWINLEVFLSSDASHRPVAFKLENSLVKGGGVLTAWTPGRSWS